MGELAAVRRRITHFRQILDIVGAMRSLAAARARAAAETTAGIQAYTDTVAEALGLALSLLREPPATGREPGPPTLIVFLSEHGFVGDLNDRLLARAGRELRARNGRLLLVGSRGAAMARERGLEALATLQMATRAAAVEETARQIVDRLAELYGRGELGRVDLIYARSESRRRPSVEHRPLLPLDLTRFEYEPPAFPPLHHLEPEVLLRRFSEEYFLAALAAAAIEAFAAENWARLETTDEAHRNLERRLEALRATERRQRQEEITQELADVLVGSEALR